MFPIGGKLSLLVIQCPYWSYLVLLTNIKASKSIKKPWRKDVGIPHKILVKCKLRAKINNGVKSILKNHPYFNIFKDTFYSESVGEMWNRHTKVPKITPELHNGVKSILKNNSCFNMFTKLYARTQLQLNFSKSSNCRGHIWMLVL